MTYKAYAVSWNLTQRCNLFCAHCYISAAPNASAAGELSTAECRRVMADMARVNPGTFLILTGGEPLLRDDIFELAAEGREHGFTVEERITAGGHTWLNWRDYLAEFAGLCFSKGSE